MNTWQSFFSALASTSASLSGLVFVGVSLSLQRILEQPRIIKWVLEGLVMLIFILIASLVALSPVCTLMLFGYFIFIGAFGIQVFFIVLNIQMIQLTPIEFKKYLIRNLIINQILLFSCVIGGISTLYGSDAGLIIILGSFLCCIVKALYNAWVVLIEIHR